MVEEQFFAFESRKEISRKISEIDELIGLQLNEILHHPEFKALEATWRGLLYLVSEAEPDQKVKILMLNVGKKDLLKDFERAGEFDESRIFEKVFSDIYTSPRGMPFGMLIGAYEFSNHPQDISLLEFMSQLAYFVQAPFITAVSPEMFGLESFGEITEFHNIPEIVNRPEYKEWQKFRDSDGSDYVGLCLPHILLRDPYKTNESFEFQETTGKKDLLWGNAAFAFGACVARAYKEKSWLGKMSWIDDDGAVEALHFHVFDTENEINSRSSLDAQLSMKTAEDLSVEGFISVINPPGTDRTCIFDNYSAKKPKIYDMEASNDFARACAKLENIFAVSRFAIYLMCIHRDRFDSHMSRSAREIFMRRWLYEYSGGTKDLDTAEAALYPLRESIVYVAHIPGTPDEYRAVMFIRPIYQLEDLLISMRTVFYLPDPGLLIEKSLRQRL